MSRICLCLTGKTLGRDLELLEKYRKLIDLAELRVDCLDPDERFLIRSFPEKAGVPVILTIRRKIDGGQYIGGEGARIALLSKGLAFADANRRRNFAYIDIEEDLDVPSLEEAARTFGTRIIRSYHNLQGVDEDLSAKIRSLRRVGDEIVKTAVMPRSLEDVIRIFRTAKETAGIDKILLGMGYYGISTRILTAWLGSHLTYAFAAGEPDISPGAPGQLDPRELVKLYRFREITPKTRLFGITGFPLAVTSSPLFFNSVFSMENINAVYLPFPSNSIGVFLQLAEELGIGGASITVPHKEAVLAALVFRSGSVQSIGACNTLVQGPEGWMGYNTDALGFSGSLLGFMKRKNLRREGVTIIGAGGVARAVAAEVFRLKGKAVILNRTVARARDLAAPYGFSWGRLDNQGLELMEKHTDIIIQTTSAGMEPEVDKDPLELYPFTGRELVMDIIYRPEMTAFLKRARNAGCAVLNGHDMFLRQARYQYSLFFKKEFPEQLMDRIKI
ncbi:MAG: type I 3-dehydroquinate dehydratase [Treponema sp.]|nr:type I 3-dehydroquinate dehydratase [Treponema sp.]